MFEVSEKEEPPGRYRQPSLPCSVPWGLHGFLPSDSGTAPIILSQSSWTALNPGHMTTGCLFVGWFGVVLFGFHKAGSHKFGKLTGDFDGCLIGFILSESRY